MWLIKITSISLHLINLWSFCNGILTFKNPTQLQFAKMVVETQHEGHVYVSGVNWLYDLSNDLVQLMAVETGHTNHCSDSPDTCDYPQALSIWYHKNSLISCGRSSGGNHCELRKLDQINDSRSVATAFPDLNNNAAIYVTCPFYVNWFRIDLHDSFCPMKMMEDDEEEDDEEDYGCIHLQDLNLNGTENDSIVSQMDTNYIDMFWPWILLVYKLDWFRLECSTTDGIHFNSLKDGFFNMPGSYLAVNMQISLHEALLFAILTRDDEELDSALCIYRLKMDGWSLAELKRFQTFTTTPTIRLTGLTSVVISIVHNDTVAFLGTAEGSVVRVVIDSFEVALEYNRTRLSDKSLPILADMSLNRNEQFLFAMTTEMIYKVPVDDCGVYSSCKECFHANDPHCGWCIKTNECSTMRSCDHKYSLSSWLPYNYLRQTQNIEYEDEESIRSKYETTTEGESKLRSAVGKDDKCLAILPLSPDSIEMLVASGQPQSIELKTLLDSPTNFRCEFTLNGSTYRVKAGRTGIYSIRCEKFNFRYSEAQPSKTVRLAIFSGINEYKPLDNPLNIRVLVYKCDQMARSCVQCVSIEPKYKCGWCQSSNVCSTKIGCGDGDGDWLEHSFDACPGPNILKFYPTSGPLEGGTLLTIEGQNFVPNSGMPTITVGKVICTVISNFTSERLTCLTDRSKTQSENYLNVKTKENEYDNSQEKFRYVQPSLNSFSPKKGPQSGGTLLSLNGEHLDAGTTATVSVGSTACNVTIRHKQQILCLTGPHFTANVSTLIQLRIDGAKLGDSQSFFYAADPRVFSINTDRTIASGGLTVFASGDNFDLVQNPKIIIRPHSGGRKTEALSSECKIISATKMECSTPKFSSLMNAIEADEPLECDIGFLLDGVQTYQNLSATEAFLHKKFWIFPTPTFNPFPEVRVKGQNRRVKFYRNDQITIEGDNIDLVARESDIRVYVGLDVCTVTSMSRTRITCRPPAPQNRSFDGGSLEELPEVVIGLGQNNYSVGYFSYDEIQLEQQAAQGAGQTGFNIGLVVVGVVLSVIVMTSGCLVWRRREGRKNTFATTGREIDLSQDVTTRLIFDYTEWPENYEEQKFKREYSYLLENVPDEIKIDLSRLQFSRADLIGKGHFGTVFKGEWRNSQDCWTDVAIKTLAAILSVLVNTGAINVRQFLSEGLLMRDFDHPRVLSLVGIAFHNDWLPLIVTPYMPNGNLWAYISDRSNSLTFKKILKFSQEIAEGMRYLETLKFVHRDLAARNCMLDGSFEIKIADFGLSRDVYESGVYEIKDPNAELPVKWMAPESIEKGIYNNKTDVWSYGVVLWELTTRGQTPYSDLFVSRTQLLSYIKQGKRLPKPPNCPYLAYRLMYNCWRNNPGKRPSFSELCARIPDIVTAVEKDTNLAS